MSLSLLASLAQNEKINGNDMCDDEDITYRMMFEKHIVKNISVKLPKHCISLRGNNGRIKGNDDRSICIASSRIYWKGEQ